MTDWRTIEERLTAIETELSDLHVVLQELLRAANPQTYPTATAAPSSTVQRAPGGHEYRGFTHFVEFADTFPGLTQRTIDRSLAEVFQPQAIETLTWNVEKLRLLRIRIDGAADVRAPVVAVGMLSQLELAPLEPGATMRFDIRNDGYDPLPLRFRVWGFGAKGAT